VQSFVKDVTATTEKQELREWEQQVKEYNDKMEDLKKQSDRKYQLEQMRIKACREVAVEYAKNQPKTVYRYTLW
jgi:hypothetical protein